MPQLFHLITEKASMNPAFIMRLSLAASAIPKIMLHTGGDRNGICCITLGLIEAMCNVAWANYYQD